VGVAHFINRKTTENLSHDDLGKAFEHLVYCELKAFIAYASPSTGLFFWRTQNGPEVDFVLKDKNNHLYGIEVKLTKLPNDRDLKGLRALNEEQKLRRKILVCNVERSRQTEDHCEMMPIMKFVGLLWQGEIL
jgi:predicted AAA+ superfamily ATPase